MGNVCSSTVFLTVVTVHIMLGSLRYRMPVSALRVQTSTWPCVLCQAFLPILLLHS